MISYENIKKIFFKFEPETAHNIAEFGLKTCGNLPLLQWILAKNFTLIDTRLSQNLFNQNFLNPIGIAGGFDKNGTMIKALACLGFGFLEVGTITPKPQKGNDKPRLFRLIEDESLQNAMGFNNKGVDFLKSKLENLYPFTLPIFVNIGKNKLTPNENALKDYQILAQKTKNLTDAFVINISSPNTPNLRDLQDENFIKELFFALKEITDKPLILKIAPDMSVQNAINLCQIAVNSGAKALILNNTSIDYSLSQNAKNFGGISGKLIKQKSKELFCEVAKELYGSAILISCGGISDANDAYERIKMGANLVQIYSSFIYQGPSICKKINTEILQLMEKDGFNTIKEAIGVNLK